METSIHELYMRRALELALLGIGTASPNPLVGCVLVENSQIIGEGWHRKAGEPHAEVNAIRSVKENNKHRLANATCYVTLEPCSHYGKTPPCADLILASGIPRVVICNIDPFEKVAGTGIRKLKDGGVEVITGILEQEGEWLNRRFFTSVLKKRPYVVLKWAQTPDGFVARENFDSKWISNESSRKLVHKWRAEEDSILVGYNTALYDNPKLNCRDWAGNDPVRIFITKETRLPETHFLMDGSVPTLCFSQVELPSDGPVEYIHLESWNNKEQELLTQLFLRDIRSVIVEGGSNTLKSFIEKNLWDEARVFTGGAPFGRGIAAPNMSGSPEERYTIEDDSLEVFLNRKRK